jgi:hypothetical protein
MCWWWPLGQLALTGLAGEFLWPGSAWWNDSAPVAMTLATAALLHLFLRQMVVDRDVPWLSRGLLVLTLIGAGILAAFLVMGNKSSFNLATPYYLGSMAVYLSGGRLVRLAPAACRYLGAGRHGLPDGGLHVSHPAHAGPAALGVATQYGAQIGAAWKSRCCWWRCTCAAAKSATTRPVSAR